MLEEKKNLFEGSLFICRRDAIAIGMTVPNMLNVFIYDKNLIYIIFIHA